jgi:DUF3071 family protein
MRELKLVGLSADGRQVLFVDETGAEFATSADDRLRAALRGDRARIGQLEIEMDSLLRPRDIQARIRSGDSPETVAALAQVPVEKIMPYCIPVLAERAHVADLARRSHVRRRGSESASRALGEVVSERLRARGIEPREAEWDAWRRDDGRWEVQTSYDSGESHRSALFIFDAVGRYSIPEDDEAKWLAGEPQSTVKGPQPREGGRVAERRLSAVPDGDDLLTIPEDDALDDDLTAVARAVQEGDLDSDIESESHPGLETETETETEVAGASLEETPDSDEPAQPGEPAASDEDAGTADPRQPAISSFLDQALTRHQKAPAQPAPAQPAPAQKATKAAPKTAKGNAGAPTEPTPERKRRSRRASVPTWDEIMFGKGDPEKPAE